jgi:uncharacterized protein YgbK (DUF1537 family)
VASVAATAAARDAVARQVAQAAVRVLECAPADLTVVTGGETAYALIQALHPGRFDLLGAPADGLALGELGWPGGRRLALLTKAGGFDGGPLLSAILGGRA